MKHLSKLTILHSNDLHGDFLAEKIDDKLVGGVSYLSGYVKQVREQEENVIYCIAGDMFRGSVIDSEYLGISTIELMNMLGPDVVTIGNHETDYGLAHLLFIEKCSNFPIINANLHIKMNGKRLFKPYEIINVGGMKVLFIGITTEEVISNTKKEGLISTLIDVDDAVSEVGKIINGFKGVDIDFTVLLTHIGFDSDIELAKKLDPEWGVDVIVGGHSHTFIKEPAKVNDILIVQAGTGTDQIGRFDIMVDTDNNCVDSYTWQPVDINDKNCIRDEKIEKRITELKNATDMKYERLICRFPRQFEHHTRYTQTQLGSLFSEIFRESLGVDIYLFGSGSIRKKLLGPEVTLKEFNEAIPYSEKVYQIVIDGHTLKKLFEYIYRPEVFDSINHKEFFQLSDGIKVVLDKDTKELKYFDYRGEVNNLERLYTVGVSEYFYLNIENCLGISKEDIHKYQMPRSICTNYQDHLEEQLGARTYFDIPKTDRLVLE